MSAVEPNSEITDEDTFSILIATDNHLGFQDTDDNLDRENDSFNTFEEILEIAKQRSVDFVLLGGDLFHENKPKPATFHRTVDILQRHCLGPKPVEFEYLGDPAQDFRGQLEPQVNYYNPNINIGLPIFTIHGNHDDPIGVKKTSAIDHLAAANLLNHFGQADNLTEFAIRPILLKKGITHLAIYGLGNIRDERLYRLMRDNKVTFLRPEEEEDRWFNIFVLHQNRKKHGPTSYFPESYIPEFMDLVIWGHEHDCRIHPVQISVNEKPVFIIQPGSSVATSLAEGETIDKHVTIIQINKRNFKPIPIPLQTVRPFVFQDVSTDEILKSKVKEPAKSVETYVNHRVKAMIDEAMNKLTGHEKQPTEPLIRIRVTYLNDNETFNAMRFSQQFAKDVANENIVLFRRCVVKPEGGGTEMDIGTIQEMIMQTENENLDDLGSHVEEIVEKHFANERAKGAAGQNMEILSEKGLSEAVRTCVEKSDKEALGAIIDLQIKKMMDHLIGRKVTADTIEQEMQHLREARYAQADVEIAEVRDALKDRKTKKSRDNNGVGGNSTDDDSEPAVEEDDDSPPPTTSRGRGARGRGRGGRGRAKSSPSESPAKGRSGARGRGRARGNATGQQKLPVTRVPANPSVIQFDSSASE